jgi:hypothetical protein
MPRPTSPFRTAVFLGSSDDSGVELPHDAASIIRNYYRDRGKLVGRKGTTPHNDRDLAGTGDQIDGIFWARIEGDDHLFAVYGGHVYETFPEAPPSVLSGGSNRFTVDDPVTFAWINQKVYAGDGTLPNVRLDQTTAAVVMPDPPAAGMTATVIAGGTLSTGVTYTYRVLFLSYDGEESAASSVVTAAATSAGNQQIRLSAIPQPTAGQDASGIRIYRIAASGTVHKRLVTLAVGVVDYVDTLADSALGAEIDTKDRRAFPPTALLCEHDGRLLGARSYDPDFDEGTLYISNYREPGICPAAPDTSIPTQGTEITLEGPAGGEITGIVSHGDRAYIYTWDACFMLLGDQPLDFSLKLFARIGCTSHRSIVSARGRLIWLAADGVYEARPAQEVRRISEPIETFLKGRTAEQLTQAHAFLFDDRYYLCFPDEARVLDLQYSEPPFYQWGEITEWPWNCSTVAYAGNTRLPRLFAGRTGEPRVWELETGEDDDGEAIPCVYTSPHWDLGNPGREKRIHYAGAIFTVGAGTATITLSKGTGAVIETYTVDLTTPTESGGEIVRFFQRAVETARAEHFRMSLSHEKTAAHQVLSLDGNWTLAT